MKWNKGRRLMIDDDLAGSFIMKWDLCRANQRSQNIGPKYTLYNV